MKEYDLQTSYELERLQRKNFLFVQVGLAFYLKSVRKGIR